MLTIQSTINIAGQTVPQIIPVVQGDTGRSILFTLADFTIPQGSTATYYVQKPSGEAVYNAATIDGNTVLVELTAQSIIEHGDNYGQVRIENDGEVVTSFDFILLVKPFRGIDATQSTTEMNIFDKAVEQASEAIDDAKDAALDEINQTTGNFAEAFSASKAYSAGEYVMQSGHLYRFTSNHAAGAWTGSDAEEVTVGEELTDVKDGFNDIRETTDNIFYLTNDHHTYRGITYDILPDGSYVFNGTATGTIYFGIMGQPDGSTQANILTAGTYSFGWETVSGEATIPSNDTNFAVRAGGMSSADSAIYRTKTSRTMTFESDATCIVYIAKNTVCNNYRLRLWINKWNTLLPYAPHKSVVDYVARYGTDSLKETTDNIFYMTEEHHSYRGITYDVQPDGSYVFNGTATATIYFGVMGQPDGSNQANILSAGTYSFGWETVSGEATIPSNDTNFSIRAGGASSSNSAVYRTKTIRTMTFESDATCIVYIASGTVCNNFRIRLWINEGNPSAYVPHKSLVDYVARQKIESVNMLAQFRIATWNIGNFNDGQSELGMPDDEYAERLPEYKEIFGKLKADMIAMQEYCPQLDRSMQHDAAEELFSPLWKYSAIGSAVSLSSDGNAIYTKTAHNWATNINFTEPVSGITRRLLHVNTTVNGHVVNVLTTALMNNSSAQAYMNEHGITGITPQEVRTWHMNWLIQYAADYDNVIILGDFNTGANGASEMTPFTTAGYKICNGGYYGSKTTAPSAGDAYAIDNIVVSGNITVDWSDSDTDVITILNGDDHIPYYADLTID